MRLPEPSRSAESVCTHSDDSENCEFVYVGFEFSDSSFNMSDKNVTKLPREFRISLTKVLKVVLANETRNIANFEILHEDTVDKRLKTINIRIVRKVN